MSQSADAFMGIFGLHRVTCGDCKHAGEGLNYPRLCCGKLQKYVERKQPHCEYYKARPVETEEYEWTEGFE